MAGGCAHGRLEPRSRHAGRTLVRMDVSAVFFDVGETLFDETEVWGGWADWLGVPRLTFFAALGAVVARDGSHREVFDIFCPERPFAEIERRRTAEQGDHGLNTDDLYPDARPCLEALRARGYRVGIAGNQPARVDAVVRRSGLPFEWLLISELLGVEKPSPAFFDRLCQSSGLPPERIAYVGDRVDNDVVPAARAGMMAIHVRRGPWGVLQASRPEVALARLRVDGLAELPKRLDETRIAG
jgi:HAD superfamily hydrolase (TIGR01662 family)